jgi:hypothetical protein
MLFDGREHLLNVLVVVLVINLAGAVPDEFDLVKEFLYSLGGYFFEADSSLGFFRHIWYFLYVKSKNTIFRRYVVIFIYNMLLF